jgi:hypothetical protein
MRRCDNRAASVKGRPALDWRGWLALAWVVWFGVQYAQMVVARRGDKVRAMLHPAAARARP